MGAENGVPVEHPPQGISTLMVFAAIARDAGVDVGDYVQCVASAQRVSRGVEGDGEFRIRGRGDINVQHNIS